MDQQFQNLVRQWRANPSDNTLAQKIAALASRSSDVNEKETYYSLSINERQAQVIIDALDAFSRIQIGQLDHAIEPLRWGPNLDHDSFWEARELLNNHVKPLLFPGMPASASHGIASNNTPDQAKIAFDIQQVIRHRIAWDRVKGDEPSFRGVHHDAPHKVSKEPLPQIEGPQACKCGRSDCKTGW